MKYKSLEIGDKLQIGDEFKWSKTLKGPSSSWIILEKGNINVGNIITEGMFRDFPFRRPIKKKNIG